MKKLLIFTLGMITGLSGTAQSVTPPAPSGVTLTVDQAVAQALANNLGLQVEGLKTQVKKRDRDTSFNRLIPTVSVSGSLSRSNTETTASGLIPVGPPDSFGMYSKVMPYSAAIDPWNLSLGVSAQLALGVAVFSGIDQTVIDYENSVISLEMAEKKLKRDVKKAFYQLLGLQESLKLSERQVANAEKRYLQIQDSYRNGLASKLAVLQSRVNWENRRPMVEEMRLGYRQALMGFQNVLGMDIQTPLTLSGSIEQPSWPENVNSKDWGQKYVDGRLDIASAAGGARALENLIKVQNDLKLPTLVFSWSADPSVNAPFKSDSFSKSTAWTQRAGAFAVMLRWQLDSWLPFSTLGVQIADMEDQLAQTRLGLEQARRGALIEIEVLVQKLKKSTQSLNTLKLNVELAEEAYQQTEQSYRSGGQTFNDLQESETQLQSAQYQVLNEKLNFTLGLLDLEYALNTNKEIFLKGEQK